MAAACASLALITITVLAANTVSIAAGVGVGPQVATPTTAAPTAESLGDELSPFAGPLLEPGTHLFAYRTDTQARIGGGATATGVQLSARVELRVVGVTDRQAGDVHVTMLLQDPHVLPTGTAHTRCVQSGVTESTPLATQYAFPLLCGAVRVFIGRHHH